MPDRSKGRGQMKYSPWSSRKNLLFQYHGSDQGSHRVVVPVKKTNIPHSYGRAQISTTQTLVLAKGPNIFPNCSYKGNHHFTEGR
jgi:hypothetical protein